MGDNKKKRRTGLDEQCSAADCLGLSGSVICNSPIIYHGTTYGGGRGVRGRGVETKHSLKKREKRDEEGGEDGNTGNVNAKVYAITSQES